jgi:hypothetical protein
MHLLRLLLCCALWSSGLALAQAPALGPELAYTNFGESRFQVGALLRIAGPPDTLPLGAVVGANVGEALVYFAVAEDEATRRAVRDTTARLLAS